MLSRMTSATADTADLEIQSVRVVRAIADTGSITAAAAQLGYSQPAVSQHLRRLETRLGLPAVERVGRGVRLTEAGRILARHAPAITTALDALRGELDELRGLRTARVRLAGFPSASPTIVPRLLASLAASHPGIEITYVEAEPPEAVAAVREDRADIALTFSYPGDRVDPHGTSARGLAAAEIGSDTMLIVVPATHAVAAASVIDVGALLDESWIAGCPRCRGHLLEVCGREGFAPRITFETDNIAAVEGLVAAGVGVAMLPHLAIASFPLLPGVATVPLPASESRSIHTITAHGADRVPAVRETLAALRRAVAVMTAE